VSITDVGGDTLIVIPVKDFGAAKSRLDDTLSPVDRDLFARHCASRVVQAARGHPALVVTDHHGTGTNVLVVPADAPFTFAFGPDSRARHVAEAHRLRLVVDSVRHHELSHDVDDAADYARMMTGTDSVADHDTPSGHDPAEQKKSGQKK